MMLVLVGMLMLVLDVLAPLAMLKRTAQQLPTRRTT
jgi:hypothetical protein